jgi:RNA polymerase sigma-70 factor (ECF subfamily)
MQAEDHGVSRMNSLDQELVNSCLQGNEKAWEDFVQCHARRIYAMSYRFTRCRAEAEDVTQEVFVRVYLTLNSYRAEIGSLSGWLMHVTRNLLIDRYRRARRHERFHPIREPEFSLRDPHAPNPLQYLARDETAVRVHTALQRLSPNTRPVIVLHDLEGLALDEVAAVLHVPVGTVKSRMIRGRRELARILRCPADPRLSSDRRGTEKADEPVRTRGHIVSGIWHAGSGTPDDPPARRMAMGRRRTNIGNSLRSRLSAGGECYGAV